MTDPVVAPPPEPGTWAEIEAEMLTHPVTDRFRTRELIVEWVARLRALREKDRKRAAELYASKCWTIDQRDKALAAMTAERDRLKAELALKFPNEWGVK